MAKAANFVVTVTPAPAAGTTPVQATYATRDGTALAGTDYTQRSGTLSFGPGETTKVVSVPVAEESDGGTFFLDVAWVTPGNLVGDGTGLCVVEGGTPGPTFKYLEWFEAGYALIKSASTGYFGPPTGSKAFAYPYHAIEKLLVEAPDSGHQSVSETISFWGKLEAWRIGLSGDKAGYEAMWASVEDNFIPKGANQVWGTFDHTHPADYQPEQDTPAGYPVMTEPFPVGAGAGGGDPLYTPLLAAYGTKNIYLMHWMIDVDGDYGFDNADGATKGVFINSFQRGMQESTWEVVTHPEHENFENGGSSTGIGGFMPLYNQSQPDYPAAPYPYSKQLKYTAAPDAEARLIQAAFLASKFAPAHGLTVTAQDAKAKKMGDYLRYCLYDKYFKQGAGVDGEGRAGLISWYVSFGMDLPASGTPAWGFRISSSNYHMGYQSPDVAYFMSPSGGAYTPISAGAGTMWQESLGRQLELLRWLQTEAGAVAGGVTNSWMGRYETPADGREAARFYGLYYTYAPEWHDPPSNNWFGFQAWGLERVACLMLETAAKTGSFNTDVYTKCAVIMDRWVNWLMANASLPGTDGISLPIALKWVTSAEVPGETTTAPNNEGVYEWLPTLDWPGTTPDYGAFWSGGSVPNPALKVEITESGLDVGSAACCAQLLLQYAHAKRSAPGGSLDAAIPGGPNTVRDVFDLAKGILDRIHDNYFDGLGFTKPEPRADYIRYNDVVHIPTGFSGTMPNGDVIAPGKRFIELRTFMKTWQGWSAVQSYIDGGSVPIFTYHRFWHTTEVLVGFGMIHRFFPDVVYP